MRTRRQFAISCLLACLFGLAGMPVFGQFTDDFSDGDFTASPIWGGETVDFEVDINQELRLNAPAVTATKYLSTSSAAINNASWEFFVRLDFNPSGSNLAEVYLTSSSADLSGSLNGYFVRIGGSADEVSLYRQDGTSVTEIIDGLDDRVDVDPVEIRVQVTRDALGNWELFTDTLAGTNYTSEGTVFDDTHIQSTHFGVFCDYTSTRSDRFFFDEFVVTGTGFVDTEDPELTSATALSSTTVDVQFNEAMDQTAAEQTTNYSVDQGIGSPASAVLDSQDPTLVHLTFGTALTNGTTYALTVNGVEDLAGNTLNNGQTNFVYFVPVATEIGDIRINEIFPDPSPPASLPELEYVELLNTSNKVFNLENWVWADASSSVTMPSGIISPGEYVIICHEDDVAQFTSFGNVLGLSSFPALNNSGDDLSLTDDQGLVVDAVSYEDSWYRDALKSDGGFSLELINPVTPCSGVNNWIASDSPTGGTPGAVNSVFDDSPDVTNPEIVEAVAVSSTQVEIRFNEGMDSVSLATGSYTLSGGLGISSITVVSPDFTAVVLNLSTAMTAGVGYTLTAISGPTDCVGNPVVEQPVTFATGVAPAPFEVVINELFPDPDQEITNLPETEFVELYNWGDKFLDLTGVTLTDGSSESEAIEEGVVLGPGEYLILCPSTAAFEYAIYGRTIGLSSFPSLNNSGDRIAVLLNGQELDAVNYTDDWYRDANKEDGGWTLERIQPDALCERETNWRASNDSEGGTPGQENSWFGSDIGSTDLEVSGALILDSLHVQLFFSRVMDLQGLLDGFYALTPRLEVIGVEPVEPELNSVILTLRYPILRGQVTRLTVLDVFDCAGNGLPEPVTVDLLRPAPQDLVINEVLFNPLGSGTDFVELYNRTKAQVNLQNWAFADFDSDDSLRIWPISSEPLLLEPGGFIVLSEDGENVLANYTNAVAESLVDTDLPSYSNSEGTVILVDFLKEEIDRFDYQEDYHFPLLRDPEGVSLERLDYERTTNDPTNWHSASEQVGFATPGLENSQLSEAEQATNEVSVSPEVFSPDNDGMDDVLNISYNFNQQGYVGTIVIYDAKGRQERVLLESELLDPQGVISWDGTLDNGEKARVGIHVILVEVFNLEGEVEQFKRTCVVATRF